MPFFIGEAPSCFVEYLESLEDVTKVLRLTLINLCEEDFEAVAESENDHEVQKEDVFYFLRNEENFCNVDLSKGKIFEIVQNSQQADRNIDALHALV